MIEKNDDIDIKKNEDVNIVNNEGNNNNNNNNNSVDDTEIKANKLTNIAGIFIFAIPMVFWCMDFLYYFGEFIFRMKMVIPLLCKLVGITILIYVRIKYPNNKNSKNLVKIVFLVTILNFLLFLLMLTTCYSISLSCKGFPG